MKKFILSLGLIAMMLNLTNCAQHDEVNPTIEPKGDFELYASISRTANDGFNTVWSANDQINVFHAEAGTETYLNDTPYANSAQNPFVCNDAATGYFLGSLLGGALEEGKSYDWYAFYPYSSYIVTPANDGAGYTYIGGRSDVSQKQTGNNSMAHIAGTNYPMAGYAKAIPANEAPALVFKHISSLIEFEVVNGLSEDITISQIEFTATEDIVGSYYINFADFENLKFTPSNTSYVSKTATLEVLNGTAIAAGSSAKFYLAVKPFTAAANSELSVKVSAISETGLGAHNKTITLDTEKVFSAGKIKPIKVNYTTAFEVSTEQTVAVGFEASEGFTATTTYNNTSTKYFGASGKQWGTICGTATTSDKITGSQSMQMRVYQSTGPVSPYVFMNYTLSSVTKISFKAKGSTTTNTLTLSYKTTGDWVDIETYTLGTSAKEFTHEFDTALENVAFKFTFVYPSNYTDKSKITIDDVVFTVNDSTEGDDDTGDDNVTESDNVTISPSGIATASTYGSYSNADWVMTCGSNNGAFGSNSNNSSTKMVLGDNYIVATPLDGKITSSSTRYAALISQFELKGISTITLLGEKKATSMEIGITYSTDGGATWVKLADFGSNTIFTFTAIPSARYAIVLKSTTAESRYNSFSATFSGN